MRRAAGWYAFRVEGLALEKLFNRCARQAVALRGVRRDSARCAVGRVRAQDWDALAALCESGGYRLEKTGASFSVRMAALLHRRALLGAGALVFVAVLGALLSCLWFVQVEGAGPYAGEVARILAAHDIRPGRLRWTLDVPALRQDLQSELTGLAWVGVDVTGVRLTVSCVQAEPADRQDGRESGDLVAVRDGVIAALRVSAGTPQVKVGDAVRAGQVLVLGQERAFDGATVPVAAAGEVEARVWYSAQAAVSGRLALSEPTGRVREVRTLQTPYFQIAFEAAPDFTDYDIHARVLPMGGVLPVWLRIERYEEVTRREITRPWAEVCAEAGRAALRLAQEKAGFDAQVVDKWIEYSMIREGDCRALAVLEAVENIAQAAPADNHELSDGLEE